MTDETVDKIEAALEKPNDELADELPSLLEETEGQIDELIESHPTVFGRIVNRMEEMDIAEFVSENPDTADQFQELLWTGTEAIVENNPELKDEIELDITVNFEATDCPMTGHLEVDHDAKTVTGGSGHLDDPMLSIEGPANALVGLIAGTIDPVQGFMAGEYQMEGSIAQGTQLAPLMNSLTNSIPS